MSGAAVLVQATATDVEGFVSEVAYAIDGGAWTAMAQVGSSDTWEATWDSTPLPNGDHEIAVRAVDDVGQSGFATVIAEVVRHLLTRRNSPPSQSTTRATNPSRGSL